MTNVLWEHYPLLRESEHARTWLTIKVNLQLAPNTIKAYGRGVEDWLSFCAGKGVIPENAKLEHIALWINDLSNRRNDRQPRNRDAEYVSVLSNATIQQKITAVRSLYDYLWEEGIRGNNPVGRGCHKRVVGIGDKPKRGILPRVKKLPWIPTEEQWSRLLQVVAGETLRNRFMFALQYDCALRREELCLLETGDFDPVHKTLRVRAETTKSMRGRVIVYSESVSHLHRNYLAYRRDMSINLRRLFVSESRRNFAAPITNWTWSKVMQGIAKRSGITRLSTHTLRHLRLTDLARAGWDIHETARFAGHESTETTLIYIHLSGRDLKQRFERTMSSIHKWREVRMMELAS